MSTKEIQNIRKQIQDGVEKQIKIVEDIQDGTMHKDLIPSFSCWLQYEGILLNLHTQEYVLKSIQDTDKITTLAYRVALISLGASLISIVSGLLY